MAESTLFGGAGGSYGTRLATMYPDPFDDVASTYMPRTMPDALRWAQSIHMIDGTYREATRRVAAYFLTDVEVKPVRKPGKRRISDEDRDKHEEFLCKKLQIKRWLSAAAADLLCYNNGFFSVLFSFRRSLYCPHCPGIEYPFGKVASTESFRFQWADFNFHATCPHCGVSGPWRHVDRQARAEDAEVVIKRWSPHEIEILHDPLSEHRDYIWKIPEQYRKYIREGKAFYLERAPWEVIQAIKHGNHLRFDPGVVCHIWDPQLAGIDSGGWGIPNSVVNFRQAFHCQSLRRFNEAVYHEHLVPIRAVSPEPKGGTADPAALDPMVQLNGNTFRSQILQMFRRHRRDPGQVVVSPVPFRYQLLGGEANQLAPFQLMDQAVDALLNASGVPAELYKGTLSVQAVVPALRLFEARHASLADSLNALLDFIVDRVSDRLGWEPVDAKLARPSHADDINRQMAKLQLMMGQQISQQTGLASVGLDWKVEQDRLFEEQEYVRDQQQEMAEKEQVKAEMGQTVQQLMAGGQQGQAQQPAGGASPEELQAKAQQIGDELRRMPDSQRQSEMIQLKKQDAQLHAVVKSYLDDVRQKQQTAGGAQLAAAEKQAAVRRVAATKAAQVRSYLAGMPPGMRDVELESMRRRAPSLYDLVVNGT